MNALLQTEIESYLALEKRINLHMDKYQYYVEFDAEKAEKESNMIDGLEQQLISQVKYAAQGLNMTQEEFINEVNNF